MTRSGANIYDDNQKARDPNAKHGGPEPPINSRLSAALQHNRGDKAQAKGGNQRHEPLIGKLLGYTLRHLLSAERTRSAIPSGDPAVVAAG
jgi:hypothetical protein